MRRKIRELTEAITEYVYMFYGKIHKAYSVLRMAGHVTTHAHEPFGMHPIHMSAPPGRYAVWTLWMLYSVLNVTDCVLSIIYMCQAKKKKKKSPISSMPAIIISICPTSFANNLAAPISFPTKTTLYEISAL